MTAADASAQPNALLQAILNLSKYHRDHEKFYSSAPREQAVVLQRHARTLQALADRWSTVERSNRPVLSPYEAAEDLNAPDAVQLDGVLFLEGEGRPAEITRMIRDLRTVADDAVSSGEWLAEAMQASWDAAAALIPLDGVADVIGERHRIIANDWQAALTAWLPNCCGEPSRFSLPWSSTRSSRGTGPRRPLRRAASRARRRSSGAPPHCSTTPPSSAMTMNGAGLSSEATCATS